MKKNVGESGEIRLWKIHQPEKFAPLPVTKGFPAKAQGKQCEKCRGDMGWQDTNKHDDDDVVDDDDDADADDDADDDDDDDDDDAAAADDDDDDDIYQILSLSLSI